MQFHLKYKLHDFLSLLITNEYFRKAYELPKNGLEDSIDLLRMIGKEADIIIK